MAQSSPALTVCLREQVVPTHPVRGGILLLLVSAQPRVSRYATEKFLRIRVCNDAPYRAGQLGGASKFELHPHLAPGTSGQARAGVAKEQGTNSVCVAHGRFSGRALSRTGPWLPETSQTRGKAGPAPKTCG